MGLLDLDLHRGCHLNTACEAWKFEQVNLAITVVAWYSGAHINWLLATIVAHFLIDHFTIATTHNTLWQIFDHLAWVTGQWFNFWGKQPGEGWRPHTRSSHAILPLPSSVWFKLYFSDWLCHTQYAILLPAQVQSYEFLSLGAPLYDATAELWNPLSITDTEAQLHFIARCFAALRVNHMNQRRQLVIRLDI